MTLDMAIETACDYSGINNVPRALVCHYADLAQKEIAVSISPVIKRFDILKTNSKKCEYSLPADFVKISKVIRRASAVPVKWSVTGDVIVIEDYGHIDIYYSALPDTITSTSSGSYVFQTDLKLHKAIPYYIAYRIAQDYEIQNFCLEQWNKINSLFKMTLPKETKIRIGKYI